jgi:hypothetical protein
MNIAFRERETLHILRCPLEHHRPCAIGLAVSTL